MTSPSLSPSVAAASDASRRAPDRPPVDVDEEVRLAVVMYGGVSLAIYMNGIAQELYRLVRSTACTDDASALRFADDALTGTERVYRRLARLTPSGDAGETVRRRFLVDVLSGTSAGGINAVYLAKALATGQSIEPLERVWIEEGDVARLLNDKQAREGIAGVEVPDPPASLFSGQRMLALLHDALEAMDDETPAEAGSLVDEIDLFTTATDLDGYTVPLHLSDGSVHERRHRHAFHFRYDPEGRSGLQRNDFTRDVNPVLAFAARCTSSFPIAFEPVQIEQIERIIDLPRRAWKKTFHRFFPRYRTRSGDPLDFDRHLVTRAYADGGYLDNKPFAHAIEALNTRRGAVPTDRKLLYVEPNPSAYDETPRPGTPPHAIRNALAAYDLARYEPIVEDIERVIARNRAIGRIQTLTLGMEEDLRKGGAACPKQLEGDAYREAYLDELLDGQLPSYGSYHRLKVARVTDDIAHFVTAAAGFDVGSDAFRLVRRIVSTWRDRNYRRYRNDASAPHSSDDGRDSETAFLLDYDLSFRMRRNTFLLDRINRLCTAEVAECTALLRHVLDEDVAASAAHSPAFFASLRELARGLMHVDAPLRTAYFALRTPDAIDTRIDPALRVSLDAFHDGVDALADALPDLLERDDDRRTRLLDDDRAVDRVCDALADSEAPIDRVADALRRVIAHAWDASRSRWQALDLDTDGSPAPQLVRDYSAKYECYDAVIYPALEVSGVGRELDPVELLRISPLDADAIVSVQDAGDKLAGTALMSFGGFLDATWREYDILWGRLDGAERLIHALAPDDYPDRAALIAEAHAAILAEWVDATTIDHEVIAQMRARADTPAALEAILGRLDAMAAEGKHAEADGLQEVMARLRSELGPPSNGDPGAVPATSPVAARRAYETFRRFFQRAGRRGQKLVRDAPEPQPTAAALGRALHIAGRMLDGIAARANAPRSPFAWLAKFGSIVSGVVTVAVPGTLGRLVFAHWMAVLYLFELTLVGLGVLFEGEVRPGTSLQAVGLAALVLTMGVHAIVVVVGWRLTGSVTTARRFALLRKTGRVVGLALVLTCTVIGAVVVGIWLFDVLSVPFPFLEDVVQRLQAWGNSAS